METSFLTHKVELVKGRVALDAMQSYAARFAAILDDWIPRFPDPHDRTLNERLVGYFYKGIEPEPLRMLVKHFRVTTFLMSFSSSEINALLLLWRWSTSKRKNLFGNANFEPDSSSKYQSQAGHWEESAEPKRLTQQKPNLKLLWRKCFQFSIATKINELQIRLSAVQIKRPRQSPYSISLSEDSQCGRQEEVAIAANSHGIANPLT